MKGTPFNPIVKWKGVTEKVVVEVEPHEILFHRRIVFSLVGEIDDLPVLKMKPTVSPATLPDGQFLATDMSYSSDDGASHVICDYLFHENTVSGMVNGALNKSRVNVVEDKLNSYSGGDTSRIIKRTYYNGFESTITYDKELGSSLFYPESPKSKGHGYYVVDVFRHGVGDDVYVPRMDNADWELKKEAAKEAMDTEKGSKAAKAAYIDEGDGPFPKRHRLNYFTGAKAKFRSDFKIYWYK